MDTLAPVLGHESARIFTPPLRELTPETSHGFRVIAFAHVMLKVTLDPWQRWWLIHALELNVDGTYRFRVLLLLVARQNGKTTVVQVLILWAIFTSRINLAVGTAQDRDIAKRSWIAAVKMAQARVADPELAGEIATVRTANGQEALVLRNGAEFIIKATTEDAGRGLQGVDLLVLDELRTHRDNRAWSALSKTTLARPNALTICMSNAGDDQSIVLNSLREAALSGRDPSIGLFEYSAPDGCDLADPDARAAANPSLGHGRLAMAALDNAQAMDPPNVYRTECLCQRVQQLRGAVDVTAWGNCSDPDGTLDGLRDRLYACLEMAEGDRGEHATLVVAAVQADGRAVVEVVDAWTSYAAMEEFLPGLLDRLGEGVGKLDEGVVPYSDGDDRPRAGAQGLWFFPTGPAAARAGWLRDLGFQEIKGAAVQEACQGLAADVRAGQVVHRDDPVLTAHVCGAERLISGDGWRFTRKGAGNVDAAYAAAGAVWAARAGGADSYDPRDSILWD